MRTVLIINPIAGQGRPGESLEVLEEEFPGIEQRVTSGRGDAERFAKEAVEHGIERIIVAGGDGTLNEVVNGLAGAEVTLGLVALGTGNVLAREIGLPTNDVSAAAKIIREGRLAKIDLGKANGRYFVLMAGIGFDAEVVKDVAPYLKDILGASAYVITGLSTLARFRPTGILLEIDERRIVTNAYLTVVANATSYAYDVKVAPRASMEDGLLDVIVFRERLSFGFLRLVARVLTRSHMKHPHIDSFTGRRIYIEAHPPVAVQIDGDYFCETPVEINVVPGALSIMAPEAREIR